MKHLSVWAVSCALMVSTSSCGRGTAKETNNNEQSKTESTTTQTDNTGFTLDPNGLEYKLITAGTGSRTAQVGDFADMHVIFKIGDTVMINTYEMNNNQAVTQQLQTPTMKGDLMEGLIKMKAGDSMVFRILMDTLAARANQPKPQWAKPGDYATWEVKMVSVKSKEEMEKATAQQEGAQKAIDDKKIQDYFKAKGIKNAKKTASGLYYVIHTPGTGANPKAGQNVTVNYTGQNLDGEKFDSNTDPAFGHTEPFSFNLGKGGVIKGWDEGVALMKKGTKATFYLPSPLGYGERGSGPKIPGNAILIFDIELLDFQ